MPMCRRRDLHEGVAGATRRQRAGPIPFGDEILNFSGEGRQPSDQDLQSFAWTVHSEPSPPLVHFDLRPLTV